MTEEEERDLFVLLDVLSQVSYMEGMDGRVCVPSKDGVFSVASFYLVLAGDNSEISPLASIWMVKAPRILIFGWLALWGSILTMVNACPLCISAV